MAWWLRRGHWTARTVPAVHVVGGSVQSPQLEAVSESMTAAALVTNAVKSNQRNIITPYESWQRELWDYYDSMGEFGYAVTWRANMISRVRLRAAKLEPGNDEPTIVDNGRPAELVAELFSTSADQADMMSSLSTFLDIPAEGWLIGEQLGKKKTWQVRSSDEIRTRGDSFEIISEESHAGNVVWRPLSSNSLVGRIWRPHRRYRHLPYSPAKAARPAMRELELVNRHIQAQYLSRLASAGLIILPDELTFPVRPEFMDEPDPFMREWIETAAEAIKTPGTAASVVPIPMRVPGEYIDKIKHIDFTVQLDQKIIEKRDSARKQLAGMINVPTELLFEAGSLNHWGLWQLEESAIKILITPDVEIIVNGLTKIYLWPMLRAEGVEDWENWVVWYDASEITTRPDKSNNAIKLYDRLELSGKALRREIGMDENDGPTDDELEQLVLRRLALNPKMGFAALHELTGFEPDVMEEQELLGRESGNGPSGGDNPEATGADVGDVTPDRVSEPVAPGRESVEAQGDERRAFTILQGLSQHVLEFNVTGWRLMHPRLCEPKLFSCPFTYALRDGVPVHPGTHGSYQCFLGATGDVEIGQRIFPSTRELVATKPWESS